MTQSGFLATPQYRVEFRKNFFYDNFADGVADSDQWTEASGTWSVASETQFDTSAGYVYKQTSTGGTYASYVDSPLDQGNYSVLVAFQIKTASGSVALIGRRIGSNHYAFKITQGSSNNLKLELQDGTQVGSLASATIAADIWYMARITFSGTSITCSISTDFISFTDKITATDSTYSSGGIGLKTYSTAAWFDEMDMHLLTKTITQATNTDMESLSAKLTTQHSTDSFQMMLTNVNGANFELVQESYEVHLWAGYAENSPNLVKVFVGYVEDVQPAIDLAQGDVLIISGVDYSVELLERPVTAKFKNLESSELVKTLIANYADNIRAGLKIQSTGYTINEFIPRGKPLGKCIEELGLIGDGANAYDSYVDVRRELNFQQVGTVSSGKTFEIGVNILSQSLSRSLNGHKNSVVVYGVGRQDTDNAISQATDDTTIGFGKSTTYQKLAQTFVSNTSEIFDVVLKPVASTGNPTVGVVVSLQPVDGSNRPTGTRLASQYVSNTEWAKGVTDGTITIPLDAKVENGVTYAIVIEINNSSALSDTDYYNLRYKASDAYANGKLVSYAGSWSDVGNTDAYFIVYPRLPNTVQVDDLSAQQNYRMRRVHEDYSKFKEIRSRAAALERAQALLNDLSPVSFDGPVETFGAEDVRPGQTCVITVPNSGISGQVFVIKELTHSITRQGGYRSILTLGKKPRSFEDEMASVEARLRAIEAQQTEDTRVSPVVTLVDSAQVIQTPNTELTVRRRNRGTGWILNHPTSVNFPFTFRRGPGLYGSNEINGGSA